MARVAKSGRPRRLEELCVPAAAAEVRKMFTGGMPPGGRMPGFWISAPSIIPAFRDLGLAI